MVRLVYFAWVRERIGKSEEEVDLPANVGTVADLLVWLSGRGEEYRTALAHPGALRVAINQEHVGHREPLTGAREIGIFPPMTGG